MLAALLLLAIHIMGPVGHAAAVPHVSTIDDAVPADGLRDALMRKFDSMNAKGEGIFHDDISAMIAPYFPKGQPFAETQKIIRQQNLGQLQMFKGTQTPAKGTMYVTKFSLMSGMFSDISVVLDFDFDGKTQADMVIKKTSAYIKAANM